MKHGKVIYVTENTPAFDAKIEVGDYIVEINGNEINDVLDYMFYASEEKLILKVLRDGNLMYFNINKNEYEDLGLDLIIFLWTKIGVVIINVCSVLLTKCHLI